MIARLIFPAIFLGIALVGCSSADSPRIRYAGGDGSSVKKAVIVKGTTKETSVAAEHAWLARKFGGYQIKWQALTKQGGRQIDGIVVITTDGDERTVFFDITEFFKK